MKIIGFGKWKNGSSEFFTEGKIYIIVGDGEVKNNVRFINDTGDIDQAASMRFEFCTRSQYAKQQQLIQKLLTPSHSRTEGSEG